MGGAINSRRDTVHELTLADITDNIVIIKINRSYHEEMSALELYDITRGCWKRTLSSVKDTEYALAAANGIVKEVYRIEAWFPAEKVTRSPVFSVSRPSQVKCRCPAKPFLQGCPWLSISVCSPATAGSSFSTVVF